MLDDRGKEPSIPSSLAAWIGKGRPVMLGKDDDEDRPCVRTWPKAEELWTLPNSSGAEEMCIRDRSQAGPRAGEDPALERRGLSVMHDARF